MKYDHISILGNLLKHQEDTLAASKITCFLYITVCVQRWTENTWVTDPELMIPCYATKTLDLILLNVF